MGPGRMPGMRRAYQTDTSEAQWAYVEVHLPSPKAATRRPRIHPLRHIVDAVFYNIVKSGPRACRLLPHGFPPRKGVYHSFGIFWRLDGTREGMYAALHERGCGSPHPPGGILSPAWGYWIASP
jgi:transposase